MSAERSAESGPERFVRGFIAQLRAKSAELRAYGAAGPAQTCERNAQDLEDAFQGWWLEELPVSEAAGESGYSEERLREMAREGTLPHTKGDGSRGHLRIARCNLPQRPKLSLDQSVNTIETRLLRPKQGHLRHRG
jgi:hypothetical protein